MSAVLLKQPDIEYHPDEAKYRERTTRRLKADPSLPKTPLPDTFPKQVSGPIVWKGSDWTSKDQWVYHLSPEGLDGIHEGMKHFKGTHSASKKSSFLTFARSGLGLSLGFISQETFPPPSLSRNLYSFAQELYSGTSRLSSGGQVYNELAAARPDLVKVLSEEWPLDRWATTLH